MKVITASVVLFSFLTFPNHLYSCDYEGDEYCGDGIVNSWIDADQTGKVTYWAGSVEGLASINSNWTNGVPTDGDIVVLDDYSSADLIWDIYAEIVKMDVDDTYGGTIQITTGSLTIIDGGIYIEECDDGNNINTDGCLNNCKFEGVGDGITQLHLGEECDAYECNWEGKRELNCIDYAGIRYAYCNVVYKAGDIPCTPPYYGNYYIDHDGEGLEQAIEYSNFRGDVRTVICPGEYRGNYSWHKASRSQLVGWSSPTINIEQPYETITASNFSGNIDYMNDTILRSRNGNTTLTIRTGLYSNGVFPLDSRVSGLRVTGADNYTCPVWINSDQGYETGEPCAGIRYYCTESHLLDHMVFEDNNVGVFVKDTDPEWDFDILIYRIAAINNNIGVKWKYGNGNSLKYSDIVNNNIGLEVTDAKYHLAKYNSFKDNPIAVKLRNQRYSLTEANKGVLIKRNNIYNGSITDSCGNKTLCPRFYYNYIVNDSSNLNWYPASSDYDWLHNQYIDEIDVPW